MTDVTGFGLAGHLLEMCQGAGLTAMLDGASLPELEGIDDYIQAGCVPGGSQRNFTPMVSTWHRWILDYGR